MYGENVGQIKRTDLRTGYDVHKNNTFYIYQDGTFKSF